MIGYDFSLALEVWADLVGRPVDSLRAFWKIDEEFDMFEEGKLQPHEYAQHLRSRMQLRLRDDQIWAGWNSIYIGVNTGVLPRLMNLRKRFARIVCVSNTNVIHHTYWRRRFHRVLRLFDRIYTSFELGSCKPSFDFFNMIAKKENVSIRSLSIIDDQVRVVRESQALGLSAVLFNDLQATPWEKLK